MAPFAGSHPAHYALDYVWDVPTLRWVKAQQALLNTASVAVTNDGTFAKETGGNLATLATRLPAQGQAVMAASLPVVVASDQSPVLVITL